MLALLALSAFAQTPDEMAAARQAEQLAVKAYQSRTYPEYLKYMLEANAARPNHPRLIYNLASAYAKNAETEKTLHNLEILAAMGLVYAVERDDDFKDLITSARFRSIQKRFSENSVPVNASTRVFSVPDKTLITESVAYNAKTKTYYLGSIHQRKIVAVDQAGKTTDFSRETDGLWSVLGMRVDIARGWLWVCSSAFPQMRGFTPADKGRSGIFKYDLRTGKLTKKYVLPDAGHALGDLTISGDGTVFATDSISPVIYKIAEQGDEMEEFVRSDSFVSLQGIAFGPLEKEMYVADYAKGIFRIETATRKIVQLTPARSVTVLGIDGLYYYRGKLIAIQNGVNPNRVISLSIDKDRIDSMKTLEANHSDFLEPTLGVLIGDEFHYVANSQWPLVNEKGELATDKLGEPIVLKLDAKKALAK